MHLSPGAAPSRLGPAANARSHADPIDTRPLGARVVIVAVLQMLVLTALGTVMAFWWHWASVILLVTLVILVSIASETLLARARTAAPRALAAYEAGAATRARWRLVVIPVAAGLLAAPVLPRGDSSPAALLICVAGLLAAAPRLMVGARLRRR